MNTVYDTQNCLEKETLPRLVYSSGALALIGLCEYCVWNGTQEYIVSAEVFK